MKQEANARSVVIDLPIKIITKSPDNPRKHIDQKELQDLADSITQNGILQPVTARTNGNGTYELIIGERRLRASELAKKDTIPAIIIDASDEEVERMQFIENLDRADVHPMDEATKYAAMLDRENSPYDVTMLADMVRKTQGYIVQRLELMKLIKSLQEDFWKDRFDVNMAILFARLSISDQKNARGYMMKDKENYKSIGSLRDYISQYIVRDLNKVPFDLKDKELYKKAGSCMACPKRSGANVLFEDIKDKNVCMDKDCFAVKLGNHTIAQMDNVISLHPEIVFLKAGYSDPLPAIEKKIEKEKLTVRSSYDSNLTSYKQAGATEQKVMFITGSDMGKIMTYYKAGTKKKADIKELKGKGVKNEGLLAAVKENIKGLEERQERLLELDDEKVWKRVREDVIGLSDILVNDKELTNMDYAALIRAMYEKSGNSTKVKMDEVLQHKTTRYDHAPTTIDKPVQEYLDTTGEQMNRIFRLFITEALNDADHSHNTRINQALLMGVVKQYHAGEIKVIQEEQDAEATKRVERARERLKKMEMEEKDLLSKIKMNNGNKKTPGKQLIDTLKEELKENKKAKKGKGKKAKLIVEDDDDSNDDPFAFAEVTEKDDEEYGKEAGVDINEHNEYMEDSFDEDDDDE